MFDDSRLQQLRQEVKAAQACLDDARCAATDIWDESPDLNPLDTADFRIARSALSRALLKANSANAALARIIDRAARAEKITANGWR